MVRVPIATIAGRIAYGVRIPARDEVLFLRALGAAEAATRAGESVRAALTSAADAVRVDEATLAVIWLEKAVQCARARTAPNAEDDGGAAGPSWGPLRTGNSNPDAPSVTPTGDAVNQSRSVSGGQAR